MAGFFFAKDRSLDLEAKKFNNKKRGERLTFPLSVRLKGMRGEDKGSDDVLVRAYRCNQRGGIPLNKGIAKIRGERI